jgi:thiol-disulfide isomerase/thioredoxin
MAAILCASFVAENVLAQTAGTSAQGQAVAAGRGLIGTPGPRLTLASIDGEPIDLGALYGKKAVYLKFWATWCIPCRQQMPHFERVYQTAGADLAVIAVNVGMNDPIEDVRRFRYEYGIHMPIVIDDGRLAAALNLQVTPQHVLIGRDGRVSYVGHLADEALDASLAEARSSAAQPLRRADRRVPTISRYGVGDRLPSLVATTVDGDTFEARALGERRPTVLVFFSPWCESYLAGSRPEVSSRCRRVREQVDALARERTHVRWLGVASGLWTEQRDLEEYRAKYGTRIPLTLDETGEWFRAFDVKDVPTVLLADPDGRLVRRVDGFDAEWPNELQRLPGK